MKRQFITLSIIWYLALLLLLTALFFLPNNTSHGGIVELLEGKDDVKVRSAIKCTEIAKTFTSAPRQRVTFSGITVDIEIIDLKPIGNGIEVLAKAWDIKNKSIGFGNDGSVEIERFIIINPPVCVEDINGIIIREYTDLATKELKQFKLREDPEQATLETLTHNIKVVGKRNALVVRNKIGNTTLTVYPSAGAAEPVDGSPYRDVTGTPETWAALRDGAGTHVLVTDATLYVQMLSGATSPYYHQLTRNIILCDASSIPDTATIDSVTASLWGVSKSDGYPLLPTTDFYTSTPASTSNLVAADYSQTGTVSQTGSPMTFAAFTIGAYNDYVFNATGRGNLSKTGISKWAWKNANFDGDNVSPGVSESTSYIHQARSADIAGTSNDPKFVIVYTDSATFTPQVIWW